MEKDDFYEPQSKSFKFSGPEKFDYSFEQENSRRWYHSIGNALMFFAFVPFGLAVDVVDRVMEARATQQEDLEKDVQNILRLLK